MEERKYQSTFAEFFGKGVVDEVVGEIAFDESGDDIFLQFAIKRRAQAVVGNVE